MFRADGSVQLGLGHVTRCLALINWLEKRGIASSFLVREYDGIVPAWLHKIGIEPKVLPSDLTPASDAEKTVEVAAELQAGVVITDIVQSVTLPSAGDLRRFHETLLPSVLTVCLSGDETVDVPAHLVVNPYYGVGAGSDAEGTASRLLAGPHYFIFRPEFLEAREVPRTIRREADRVLVTVGGSDKLDLTEKILQGLVSTLSAEKEVRIFTGAGFSDRQKRRLRTVAAQAPFRTAFLGPRDKISESMLWADVGILGDGLVKYEAALLGLPSLVISLQDDRPPLSLKFDGARAGRFIGCGGRLSEETISKEVSLLLSDYPLRSAMAANGRRITDGRGAERILDRLETELRREP